MKIGKLVYLCDSPPPNQFTRARWVTVLCECKEVELMKLTTMKVQKKCTKCKMLGKGRKPFRERYWGDNAKKLGPVVNY